ncbi:MAG: hypothetical protein U5K81_11900 [Trueperaceae bacterium]|nr:hypothetical protein [Trueperaceae bacterium]
MIRDRSGAALGMDVTFLARTPFPDFLLPGWILLGVLGVYPLVVLAALMIPRHPPAARVVRGLRVHGGWSAGVALIVWITAQMGTTSFFFWQPVMLGLGLALVSVGTRPSVPR